jgi:hypothetical protein
MRPKEPRLPYAGLVDWLQHVHQLEHAGYRTIARITGMSLGSVSMWSRTGIPMWTADRLAIKLGAHPADIWPEEWWTR